MEEKINNGDISLIRKVEKFYQTKDEYEKTE